MKISPHIEDADKIIGFFQRAPEIYRNSSCESLISFCLQVFGLERYDIAELDSAYNDLQTIIMLISREMDSQKGQEFNVIAKGFVNKYYKWLIATYNGQISDRMGDILFSDDLELNLAMFSDNKILTPDYFQVISDYRGYPDVHFTRAQLSEEDSLELGCDVITVDKNSGGTVLVERGLPWTDCIRLWIGNQRNLETILNGKYRKAKDKRLKEIIKNAYEKFDDDLLYKTIYIEQGALDKKDSFKLDFNTKEDDCIFAIRKK